MKTLIFPLCLALPLLVSAASEKRVDSEAAALIEKGDLNGLSTKLEHVVNLEAFDGGGHTLLMIAVLHKQPEAIRLLLEHGVDPNTRTLLDHCDIGGCGAGKTALRYAAAIGDVGSARLLVEHGADSKSIQSAFRMAANKGHEAILSLLLKSGADINEQSPRTFATPLIFAAQSGKLNAVRLLLDHGANMDAVDCRGYNALLVAVSGNHPEVAELLLQRGSSVNSRDQHGITALMCAIAAKDRRMVETLLKKGADVRAADDRGRSALDFAFMTYCMDPVIMWMVFKTSPWKLLIIFILGYLSAFSGAIFFRKSGTRRILKVAEAGKNQEWSRPILLGTLLHWLIASAICWNCMRMPMEMFLGNLIRIPAALLAPFTMLLVFFRWEAVPILSVIALALVATVLVWRKRSSKGAVLFAAFLVAWNSFSFFAVSATFCP